MRVTVSRGAGDKKAPEILIDPLCTRHDVATERGRTYLYDNGFTKRIYTISIPYRGEVYPGMEYAIHDSTLGESFVARVTAHNVSMQQDGNGKLTIRSVLTVVRSMVNE